MVVCTKRVRFVIALTFLLSGLSGVWANAEADELSFSIHPILSRQEAERAFQPLAAYLQRRTGHTIRLITSVNYLTHWQLNLRNPSDLIIEGPHMVDYRVSKKGYSVLAKIPDVISFSMVTHDEVMVLEPSELVAKYVATMPPPSLGALRLNQFFPNPLRQPIVVEVDNMEEAVKRIMEGKAAAALIPSTMVGRFPELNTVVSTEQAPAPGIVAAPWVKDEVKRSIRQALIEAQNDPEGKAALEVLRLPHFEAATAEQFRGYSSLLEGMWGY